MKIRILIFLQFLYFPLFAQEGNIYQYLKQKWSKEFSSAKDITTTYHDNIKRMDKKNIPLAIQNNCFMILYGYGNVIKLYILSPPINYIC